MYNKIPIKICAFNDTKKNEYPLLDDTYRGVFIFCIELNGNLGHIFDVVYINGFSISKIVSWGDSGINYSIYNKHLIVECTREWSYGIVASNFFAI